MYKSLDICPCLCTFASVNVTIDARASIFYLYSIGSIYNHEIPRSASHDLGIFIFPEFYWQNQGERLWAKYLPTRQDYNRKEDRMANRRN